MNTDDLTVDQIARGNWGVFDDNGKLLKDGFATQSSAWSLIDRKHTHPIWKSRNSDCWGPLRGPPAVDDDAITSRG